MSFQSRFVIKYFQYWLRANKVHAVHSPFVFSLVQNVLRDKRGFYAFSKIENRRKELLANTRMITITDLGAGSSLQKVTEKKVCDIARSAAKSPKYGQLLFRLVNYFQPRTIIELGTSLGISGSYLASANSGSQLFTLEGSEEIAHIASETFSLQRLNNIRIIQGNFEDTLAPLLQRVSALDMAFIDGNHRKEPTLRYFSQCLTQAHPDTVFIFDDIHWSKEMEEAWKIIQTNPAVTLTIDLFFLGLVFLKTELKEKQHFILRF